MKAVGSSGDAGEGGADLVQMSGLQEAGHGVGHDYDVGSPHLRHSLIRSQVVTKIRQLVEEQYSRSGECRVLEVGAGHGGFTDILAAAGADVTVTEMSRPSLALLQRRYARNPRVHLLYDRDGEAVFRQSERYDIVLCISVLHHIPDYLAFISRLSGRITGGGVFACFQDPLWYPRRNRANRCVDRGAYYLWRVTQPDLRGGLSTRIRRIRGVYNDTDPADMVEYHVVRSGVDERAICDLLRPEFSVVTEWRYWSTQSPLLQKVGSALNLSNTFGIIAQGRS